ncbi:hypothetical protein AWRI1631_46900 [Saccharomyces cerevisiae AWRI1631]|uniref:Uncharacterized protein n=1 Tax=Saccharomyces cerevisiae (strain AWRI1631) TaxID=545124 RepID=B5VH00_YEAS6|nr:hypothetical protein AWRI1631_46900 [Saccharomyces cerevisiae AWRI1631]
MLRLKKIIYRILCRTRDTEATERQGVLSPSIILE